RGDDAGPAVAALLDADRLTAQQLGDALGVLARLGAYGRNVDRTEHVHWLRGMRCYFGRFSSPGYGRIGFTAPLGCGFGMVRIMLANPQVDHPRDDFRREQDNRDAEEVRQRQEMGIAVAIVGLF